MTLDSVIDTVTESHPDAWNKIVCGAGGGPSYRDEFGQVESSGNSYLEHNAHIYVASYRPNVSITMAWGLELQDEFKEDWLSAFPDGSASRDALDIFYNAALIFRASYLVVDGARAFLPMGTSSRDRAVSPKEYALVKLIDEIVHGGNSEYDDYFTRGGMRLK